MHTMKGTTMHKDTWHHPSGLRLLELCPRYLNNENRDQSAAERGHRIHKAIETGNYDGLDAEEMECAAKCLEYKDRYIGVPVDGAVERRELKMRHPRLRLLGTADYVQFRPAAKEIILADWKSGRKEQEAAAVNLQFQCYAFMLLEQFVEYDVVESHLVAPLTPVPYSTAKYDRTSLPAIEYRIQKIIAGLEGQPVPHVGVCDWCGDKAECPALKQVALLQAAAIPLPEPIKLGPGAVITPDDRAKMQMLAVILEDWAKQVKAANTAAVVQDGVEIPGFVLRNRAGNVKVNDTAKAVSLLKGQIPEDRVLSCATLSLPQLASVFASEKGGSAKDSREILEAVLKDLLVHGEPVVYLQRGRAVKDKEALING